ncbi:MAG: glycosyltransferase family 2 protein [Bacteroidaceae bacterium]|nr:glycosyltransferase family 2 protein [Bacteroidaceae bacterium]
MEEQETNVGKPRLWMVIPCYNEEEVLPTTMVRIRQLLADMVAKGQIDAASRAIYIDDCSTDKTWALVSRAAAACPVNGGLRLGENCGQQNALMAGLETAVESGGADMAITIDADLQDDLDTVPQMVALYHQGNDIVYGVRNDRTSDTSLKRVTARMFYCVMHWLMPFIIRDHSEFRLMSSRVIQHLRCYDSRRLFLRAVIPQIELPQATVYYSRHKRQAGKTKYNLWGMLRAAFDAIICVYTGKFADTPSKKQRYRIMEKII